MARTIKEIQQSIIAAKNADTTLAGLTSTSNVAIWLLWTYIVAVAQWALESLFDAHKAEVTQLISSQKPHTLQWYVLKARQFQYGQTLAPDTDSYPTPTNDPTVRIIQYAAAVELTNLVRIKAATLISGILAPLLPGQLTAFTAYMQQIKDAGVRLQVTSNAPDVLRVAVTVHFNPLVLDSTGSRLDGTATTPVKQAVNNFLANLPFNGLFVVNQLLAAVQAADGVVIAEVGTCSANYASLPFTPFTLEYLPDAGYMVLDDTWFDAHITYSAHAPF